MKGSKTLTVTTTRRIDLTAEEIADILRERFYLDENAKVEFEWNDDFMRLDGAEITWTVEETLENPFVSGDKD